MKRLTTMRLWVGLSLVVLGLSFSLAKAETRLDKDSTNPLQKRTPKLEYSLTHGPLCNIDSNGYTAACGILKQYKEESCKISNDLFVKDLCSFIKKNPSCKNPTISGSTQDAQSKSLTSAVLCLTSITTIETLRQKYAIEQTQPSGSNYDPLLSDSQRMVNIVTEITNRPVVLNSNQFWAASLAGALEWIKRANTWLKNKSDWDDDAKSAYSEITSVVRDLSLAFADCRINPDNCKPRLTGARECLFRTLLKMKDDHTGTSDLDYSKAPALSLAIATLRQMHFQQNGAQKTIHLVLQALPIVLNSLDGPKIDAVNRFMFDLGQWAMPKGKMLTKTPADFQPWCSVVKEHYPGNETELNKRLR